MTLTKAHLDAKLAELDKAEAQAIANLNAIAGARQVLKELVEELARPEPVARERAEAEA